MKNIASVVINNSTKQFDKCYSYIIPHEFLPQVVLGVRVIIPFGNSNRLVYGMVVEIFEFFEESSFNYKKIFSILDQTPVLNEELIWLSKWMKQRYICTYYSAIRFMLPAGIAVKKYRTVRLLKPVEGLKGIKNKIVCILSENNSELEYDELKEKVSSSSFAKVLKALNEDNTVEISEVFSSNQVNKKFLKVAFLNCSIDEAIDAIEGNQLKKISYIKILEILLDNEYVSVEDLVRLSETTRSTLNTLQKRGYIEFKQIEVVRGPYLSKNFQKTYPLKPTAHQEYAISTIIKNIETSNFYEVLLHGITGSGKTEVYLQVIDFCLLYGRTAIVLVPEIALTPQMADRFIGRFGEEVAILHSRLSLGEKYDQWRQIKNKKAKVVVGARSAIFAPLENIGVIIIDEEHETTYKSEITPKYHVKEIAQKRCLFNNAVLIYGSATPSEETYYKSQKKIIDYISLSQRPNSRKLPDVHIIDMKKELSEGNKSIFSKKLFDEIRMNIDNREQTILFLNRRGYASFILYRRLWLINKMFKLQHHSYIPQP